jgi:glycosyltransferase involved in cell wall biosynthesis
MHTVSVVIPSYNREKYIEEAVNSVLSQELPIGWSLEIIIADDGSTDKTVKILESYGNKITLLKLKHSGKPAVPRNAALKVAKGELLAFQDSDDLWVKGKLKKQIPLFDDGKVMLSFGQAEIIRADGSKTGNKVVNEAVLLKAKNYSDLLKQNPVSTLTVMARKEAIESVGGFNESDELRAIEDYDLWLRIAARFPGSLNPINKTLAYYRRHNQNISLGNNLKGVTNALTNYRFTWEDKSLTEKDRNKLEKHIFDMEINWSNVMNSQDKNKGPTVSIVMSVYNGEHFLKAAIDSILNQTYQNFEFIIINDGSQDSSLKIIKGYQDPRIRLIDQTNHGFIYSLNKGVEIARGKYIARMDQDDLSMPTRLQKQIKLLNDNPRLGAVSTFFESINFEDSMPTGKIFVFPSKNIDLKRALYVNNPMAHGSTTFRKDAWREVGGYHEEYAPPEDYDLWCRIAINWELGMVPEVLFQYRINNPDSMSQKSITKLLDNAERIKKEFASSTNAYKSTWNIYTDYKSIKNGLYDKYTAEVRKEYLNLQLGISRTFIAYYFPLKALPTILGVTLMNPLQSLTLWKTYPRCVLVSMARKLRLARSNRVKISKT